MSFHTNLLPAYGRDYKSAVAVRLALAEGKDFIINDVQSPWYGKPVNLEQLRADGKTLAYVRYDSFRKVVRVDISRNIE